MSRERIREIKGDKQREKGRERKSRGRHIHIFFRKIMNMFAKIISENSLHTVQRQSKSSPA
jgi:hypothetical protein